MSSEAEQTIRVAFTWTGDLRGTIQAHYASNVVYYEDRRWPGAGAFEGREAVTRRFEEYLDFMEFLGAEVEEVVEGANCLFWTVRLRARGAGSGAPIEHVWAYTGRVEDGQVTEFRAHFDPAEARAAAGLPA